MTPDDTSVLISRSAPPEDSIFYTACCILEDLKAQDAVSIDHLYSRLKHKYNRELEYAALSLALSFLFLVERVELQNGKIKKCT